MSSRPRTRAILAAALLIVAVAAIDATLATNPGADEIREALAKLQHIPDNELPLAELEIDPGARVAWWISRDEAIEDAGRFFYLLRHGWCGYEFFRGGADRPSGGVDPFVEAERAVLARLGERSRWTPGALTDLIYEQLAFVIDCHLRLGDRPFCSHEDFWFDQRLEIREEDGAHRFTLDGESHLLLSIEGADPAKYLVPSFDAAGEKIFLLGTLSSTEPELLVLTAKRANEEVRLRRRLSAGALRGGKRYAEERIGGIPVVRMRSFADYYGRELKALVDRAQTYRGEPYVILDVRGNGGGSTEWPRRWIYSFTGSSPSLKQALTELVSRTSMAGRANLFALMASSYREQERAAILPDLESFRAQAASFDEPGAKPYWSWTSVPAIEPIPNATTLIVIQDRRVASAGEGLISYLLDQVENVVFVGENTMGALTFGQVSAHRLPHSKLLVYVPIKLNMQLDLEFREAKGFLPDYWVPSPRALNHAVAAARAGTIPTQVALPAGYFDAEFVPERLPALSRSQRRDLVIGSIFLVAGVVFAIVNRKKAGAVFLAAGSFALVIGAGYLYFGSLAGYAFGVVGCAYLTIGLAKRRRTN